MSKRWTDERRRNLKDRQLSRTRSPRLAEVIERNICTIMDLREEADARKTTQDRIADAITSFSGSMMFVYIHVAFFAGWIVVNVALGNKAFDPYPFSFLTLVVSLEAIFLATFVLISQNRMAAISDERADLDLQINLLAEYEVTRMLRVLDAIATKVGVEHIGDEIKELEMETRPEEVLQHIEARTQSVSGAEQRASGASSD